MTVHPHANQRFQGGGFSIVITSHHLFQNHDVIEFVRQLNAFRAGGQLCNGFGIAEFREDR